MLSRKLKLFISMSLDGYLAGANDDLSWLSIVEEEGEDYGYQAFTETIDTYIVGRKTYEVVKNMVGTFPQEKLFDCYVLTRQSIKDTPTITFYNGDIVSLIKQLKQKKGKDIWCDGGAEIVKICIENDLIDEYIISIIPVLLGKGKRLFREGFSARQLEHIETKSFGKGLVQVHYKKC